MSVPLGLTAYEVSPQLYISPLYAVLFAVSIWTFLLYRVCFKSAVAPMCLVPGHAKDRVQLHSLIDADAKEKLGLIEEDFLPKTDALWTVCDKKGTLNIDAVGVTEKPMHICNLSGPWSQLKKWNRWFVQNNQGMFCVSLMDLSYCYSVSIIVYIRSSGKFYSLNDSHLYFTDHSLLLPAQVGQLAAFKNDILSISFSNRTKNYVILRVKCTDFGSSGPLEAEIPVLFENNSIDVDGLHTIIPKSKTLYHYLANYSALPAAGYVRLGGEYIFQFNHDLKDHSFATFDFVRGIFPRVYTNTWCSASGYVMDSLSAVAFSFNLSNSSGKLPNENCVFLDGQMYKISKECVLRRESKGWSIRCLISSPIAPTKVWYSSFASKEIVPQSKPKHHRATSTPSDYLSENKDKSISRFMKPVAISKLADSRSQSRRPSVSKAASKPVTPKAKSMVQFDSNSKSPSSDSNATLLLDDDSDAKDKEVKICSLEFLKKSAAFLKVGRLITDLEISFESTGQFLDQSGVIGGANDTYHVGVFSGWVQIGIRKVEFQKFNGWIIERNASW